jgi:hypothetical protein
LLQLGRCAFAPLLLAVFAPLDPGPKSQQHQRGWEEEAPGYTTDHAATWACMAQNSRAPSKIASASSSMWA